MVEGFRHELEHQDERVHGLVRELARRTGHSQTKVVEEALELLITHLDHTSESRRERVLELLGDFDQRMTSADKRRLTTDGTPSARMSAANYLETAIAVDGRSDPVKSRRLDEVLGALGVDIVAVTPDQAHLARQACREFGKGSGHPAGPNFGDIIAYALATESGDCLLFKGDDFTQTDVRSAI